MIGIITVVNCSHDCYCSDVSYLKIVFMKVESVDISKVFTMND